MTAAILDGKVVAEAVLEEVASEVENLAERRPDRCVGRQHPEPLVLVAETHLPVRADHPVGADAANLGPLDALAAGQVIPAHPLALTSGQFNAALPDLRLLCTVIGAVGNPTVHDRRWGGRASGNAPKVVTTCSSSSVLSNRPTTTRVIFPAT